MSDFVDLLRHARLCEGLAEDDLHRFAACVTSRSCTAGEFVSFTFVDFTQTPRLAEVGEAAAEQALPRLKELLSDLDRQLAASRSKAGGR